MLRVLYGEFGASLMETERLEEKEKRDGGKEREKERFHTDYNRDSQTLVRGSKSMSFISSRDLQREMGMGSQLPPNI